MKCPTCNGAKKLHGPDGSEYDCQVCNGTGTVPDPPKKK